MVRYFYRHLSQARVVAGFILIVMCMCAGIGYSGFPWGCSDSVFPWKDKDDSAEWLHTKDPYICHAVSNAILNKCTPDVAGARIYVMEYPNSESAKVIIQSGIVEVVVLGQEEQLDDIELQAGQILLTMAGVQVRYCKPSISRLSLDFLAKLSPTTLEEELWTNEDESVDKKEKQREWIQQQLAKEVLLEEANYDATLVIDNGKSQNFISWQDYL